MDKKIYIYVLLGFIFGIGFISIVYFGIKYLNQTGQEEQEVDYDLLAMETQLETISGAEDVKKLARVGREYIFQTDYDNELLYAKKHDLTLSDEEILDILIDESILLQVGEENGWIALTSDVFNNPYKDFEARALLLIEMEDYFNLNEVSGTYVEAVSVWFNNQQKSEYVQQYGIETAKDKALSIIQDAYQRATVDTMSMRVTAQQMIQDPILEQLDPYSYTDNAYMLLRYEDIQSEYNLYNTDVSQFMLNAQEGDISEIFLRYGVAENDQGEYIEYEEQYVFYKMGPLKNIDYSFDDLVTMNKSNFVIEMYDN